MARRNDDTRATAYPDARRQRPARRLATNGTNEHEWDSRSSHSCSFVPFVAFLSCIPILIDSSHDALISSLPHHFFCLGGANGVGPTQHHVIVRPEFFSRFTAKPLGGSGMSEQR